MFCNNSNIRLPQDVLIPCEEACPVGQEFINGQCRYCENNLYKDENTPQCSSCKEGNSLTYREQYVIYILI
jgi:hypothetical protein